MRSTAFRIAYLPTGTEAIRLVFFVYLGAWVTGCGGSDPVNADDSGDPNGAGESVVVSGAVQKGPFILGAQVQLNLLDSVCNPTGAVFNTTTTTDKGEFSVSVNPSVVDLVTNGFYYNEGTWKLSAASISMRALAEITASGPQEVYVNALTHMAQRRALNLYAGGAALSSAVSQAEGEVRGVFAALIPPESLVSGTEMNLLGGDTPSNAYLLALSCYVSQAALNLSDGTDNDAQLQQLINNIATDLETDGVVDPLFIEQKIDQASTLDPYECVASLQKRLEDIGDLITVLPDPQQVFDLDRDGIPNSDDTNDPIVSLAVIHSAGAHTQLLVVRRDSGHAIQLIGDPPPPSVGGVRYNPVLVTDATLFLTDAVEVVATADHMVIRRGDGTVNWVMGADYTEAQPVTGIASAAVGITVSLGNLLLVIDDTGNVTRHQPPITELPASSLPMSNVVRVAGGDPNYVYLDNTGTVRIVEGVTVTDVLGFGGITITDVAAGFQGVPSTYMALSDAGALYRFSAAAPTAVEDARVPGILSLHISNTVFAVTAGGVWDLFGLGSGSPVQVTDVAGLTSFYGPVTWGESGINAYVATDSAGDVQLIHFSGDLSINSLFRQVYVAL